MAALSIMIVDDEPHIRNILKINLAGAGYDVSEFINATEALAAIATIKPALIISDHEMPGSLNGLDLLRHLRAQPATPAGPDPMTPFILLTGSMLLHLQLKSELQAISNLELQGKPFSIRKLLKIVQSRITDRAPAIQNFNESIPVGT